MATSSAPEPHKPSKTHRLKDVLLSSGVFFAGANVAASLLNYAFQLMAARGLDVVAFGKFTTWVAYLSMGLVAGSVSQFAANFLQLNNKTLIRFTTLAIAISTIGGLLIYYMGNGQEQGLLAFHTVICAILFLWLVGQFQARLSFYVVGSILFLSAFAKLAALGFGFVLGFFETSLYWSYLSSYTLPLLAIFVLLITYPIKVHQTKRYSIKEVQSRIVATALLALASTMIPQIDILAASQILNSTDLGEFSRVSLFSKAMFFGLFIFAQWLLPHQISSSRNSTVTHSLKPVAAVLIMGLSMSVLAALLGPYVTEFLLNFQLDAYRSWIFLSCLNMSFLIAIYFEIQRQVSQIKLKWPISAVIAVITTYGVSITLYSSMTSLLIFVVCLNGILFSVLYWKSLTEKVESHGA